MGEVKLAKEKQGKLQTISKIISIVSIVCRVFCIIGIVGVVIAMLVVPFVTGSIKVTAANNTIKVFDNVITYERNDEKITFNTKDDTETVDNKDAVFALNKILDYLEKNDLSVITIIIEATLVFAIAIIVLTFMLLGKLRKLFNNIHDGDTPFTMENVGYIRNIAYILIAMACIKIAGNGIVSILIANNATFSFDLTDILYILILFAVAYIFEYGYGLQKDSEHKIYE